MTLRVRRFYTTNCDTSSFASACEYASWESSLQEKAEFAFRVYDVGNTGSIDKMDVSHMLTSVIQANPTMKIDNKHMELLLEKVSRTFYVGVLLLQTWLYVKTLPRCPRYGPMFRLYGYYIHRWVFLLDQSFLNSIYYRIELPSKPCPGW